MKIWTCTIGETDNDSLPEGADFPMRQAVERAYMAVTGRAPNYIFSGWNGELAEEQIAVNNYLSELSEGKANLNP